jgi:hypothetical protein
MVFSKLKRITFLVIIFYYYQLLSPQIKNKKEKPARIPPQTPPAGGQNPQIRNQSRKSEIQIPKKSFSLFRVQI